MMRPGTGPRGGPCPAGRDLRRLLVLAFLVSAAANPVPAQIPGPAFDRREVLSIELWSIDDTIIHGEVPPEVRFLQEARYTISGMLYGWSFRYVPASRARRVDQEWELEPHARIPGGDAALTVREVAYRENMFYGVADYALSREDQARLQAWSGVRVARSRGVGSTQLMGGTDAKLLAIEEAIRDALDRHLREVVPNRPREAWGDVMLAEPPRIRPVAGTYEARVTVLLRIEAVRPYLAY